MADQLKNLMIGLFVIAAVTIVVLVLLFLHPTAGDEGRLLKVRFANIDKISLGTRVTFGGKPVGEVVEIRELPDAIDNRIDTNGYVYVYELTLRVDTTVNVYESDDISAKTSGLLGEKSIAITPRAPKKGRTLLNINDQVIYATESGSVEETLRELKELSDKAEETLTVLTENLTELRDQHLWAKLGKIGDNIVDITTSLNQPEELEGIVGNLFDLSEMVVETWDTIDEAATNFRDMSANTKTLAANIAEGKGSVGELLVKDDFYLKLSALLNKANVVLNDINHYGLLYHSDKGWQRLRARRLNLLTKLCTPQEFRNYFNDELDQISTSISRVSMVLDASEGACCCEELIDCGDYKKVYAELMRRVESLQESIQMYNQQMMDQCTYQTELIDNCKEL